MELGLYHLRNYTIGENDDGVVVEVVLGRGLMNIIFNIYVPSFLLMAIASAATLIKGGCILNDY